MQDHDFRSYLGHIYIITVFVYIWGDQISIPCIMVKRLYVPNSAISFACLDSNVLQDGDQVRNALLQRNPVNLEQLLRLVVVVPERLVFGQRATRLHLRSRQTILELGELVPHDTNNLLVGEQTGSGEEAMAASFGQLRGKHMGLGNVTNVDPQSYRCGRRDLLLPLALEQCDNALVGGVDGFNAGKVRNDGTKDQGWADGDEVEVGLLVGDKVPG